ncbi:protein SPO16 homolog isoform X2 [Nelusetta ayraudi]|uniref:protein SPO16 homolog isoform X2 n=1 Tax=Nelusetta ayraudi TaxID=303726 RepID=UPI003F71983E
METRRESTPQWKTTIIVSTALKNHETSRILGGQQHRIRFSDGVESGAFIFPLSGTAFLLVEPEDVPGRLGESGLLERIDKFFGSNLRVLPVRSYAEMAKGMLAIAKATSKPHADILCHRMSLVRAQIIERSPCWEMLRDIL